MSYAKIAKSYKTASIQTASPGKLILMLFDGALRFIDNALSEFAKPSATERNEAIHNNLAKAQAIIAELQSCLNMEIEGEFPKTMHQLYDYMYNQIQTANQNKSEAPLHEIKQMLKSIRDSWNEMLMKSS